MRAMLLKRTVSMLVACFAAATALADDARPRPAAYHTASPVVGGLSLVPERWRYRAVAAPIVVSDAADVDVGPAGARLHSNGGLQTLENAYVPDRESFINTLRARRGLSLLTLWEGAGRCLFLGVDEHGRAGISLVRVRNAARSRATPATIHTLYAELTGQPRATFPEPPRLFPH